MTLDAIPASENLVMTAELIRLFIYAHCNPGCHGCGRPIREGQVFKLVSHTKPNEVTTDEMCCGKCGEASLVRRDKKEHRERVAELNRSERNVRHRGYSRPSRSEGKTHGR